MNTKQLRLNRECVKHYCDHCGALKWGPYHGGSVQMLHLDKSAQCCDEPYYVWVGDKNDV